MVATAYQQNTTPHVDLPDLCYACGRTGVYIGDCGCACACAREGVMLYGAWVRVAHVPVSGASSQASRRTPALCRMAYYLE